MTLPPTTAIQPLLPTNAIPQNGPTQLMAAPNFSPPVPIGKAFLPVSQKLIAKIE